MGDYTMRNSYEVERQRMNEIPPRIIQLSYDNPAIDRIIHEYALGNISFLNEALAQMVIILATNWKDEQRRALELLQSGVLTYKSPE